MFDRFKFNRKKEDEGIECPLCQQKNPPEADTCSRCSYQLQKATHQQEASVDEGDASDLFDELLEDFEEDEEEEVVDWSKTTFTMDDVTIDVKQYGKDDSVVTKQKPSFAFTVDLPEPSEGEEEETYVLRPEDAPEFVTKFEVPDSEPETIEEIAPQQVELIQPTSESADEVEIVAASEILDATPPEDEPEQEPEQEPESEPEQEPEPEPETKSLSDLTVDQLKSMASERGLSGYSKLKKSEIISLLESEPEPEKPIPPPPIDLPPPRPPIIVPEVDEDQPPMPIPPPPNLSFLRESAPIEEEPEVENIWPWAQQEMWPGRKVAQMVKSAMEAARSKNMAQATVILDEVGPHLGDRTKLVYPIGALLQRIGRAQAVDRLLEVATKTYPEDPNVSNAKEKLRP